MRKINPFSAVYYIKENRGRSVVCIIMLVLAAFMFLAGNYISSEFGTYDKEFEYSDKLVVVELSSTDEEYKDYREFRKLVEQDENLDFVDSTAYGYSGISYDTVMNISLTGQAYVFSSVDDMKKVFDHLGIDCDYIQCTDKSIVISRNLAQNRGLSTGDIVDRGFDQNLNGEYRVGAVIDDGSFCTFYLVDDSTNLGRLYIFSNTMEGRGLYDYVVQLAGDKKVHITQCERDFIAPQFNIYYILFYLIDLMVSVVLAVTINSVITGHYIKRTYEFGIYRALGRSRRDIKKKVAAEMLMVNAIACTAGAVIIMLFTYLINELIFKPKGLCLLYMSWTGLLGFVICDLLVMIPVILSKGKKMCQADVTEF